MIWVLWDRQADSIIVIKLGNPEGGFYKYEPMVVLLAWWETIKKYKHGEQWHDQQKCFSLFVHDREGSPGRTDAIESNHGRKNGRTHFTCTAVDKRSNSIIGCDILLTYAPRRSTPQPPAGQGSGLGFGIRNWVGMLNRAQA